MIYQRLRGLGNVGVHIWHMFAALLTVRFGEDRVRADATRYV